MCLYETIGDEMINKVVVGIGGREGREERSERGKEGRQRRNGMRDVSNTW